MLDIDLRIGDKIMFIGNEQIEYFTFGKAYEIKSLKSVYDKTHIMLMDDSEEENYISISFYRRNFRKVAVTIMIYDDDTFTTETELETLNWNNNVYTLETLISLLISLDIGFEVKDLSTRME